MPYKDPAKQRESWLAWYGRNRERVLAKYADGRRERLCAHKAKLSAWVLEYKDLHPCEHCGETHPACLQFHHRDGTTKELEVSNAVRDGWNLSRLQAEAAKCAVLCANCHLKHHAKVRSRRAAQQ